MFKTQTFSFLKELKKNNSKEWMDENRSLYELAKKDVLKVTGLLIAEISKIDSGFPALAPNPEKCITRINRDLRFSKDKTPYKTDYYIVLNKNGKNSSAAFYYLHIEPGNSFVGGGLYNPQAAELKKIREEIDYSYTEWQNLLNNDQFSNSFPNGIQHSGTLKKTPKGYETDNPAIEFLKMKGYYTQHDLTGPGDETIEFMNDAPDGNYEVVVEWFDGQGDVSYTLLIQGADNGRTFTETIDFDVDVDRFTFTKSGGRINF